MALYREIGLASSTFLVVGNIIGIGIFTTSGLIADQLGPSPWLIAVWCLGGGLALIGAICYSWLGTKYPRAGGEYALLRPTYGPLVAFLAGWASLLIGFTAPIAASALGLAHYTVPLLLGDIAGEETMLRLTAMVALLLVSFLISAGLKAGSNLHSTVTVLNISLILVFVIFVFYFSQGQEYLGLALPFESWNGTLPSLASAVILVMFTYSGWNAAAYIAEEIRSPGRNIPGALLIGTLCVITLYILVNLAFLGAAPLSELRGKVAVAEIAASHAFGPAGRSLVNVLIIVSILSSLTAMSIAGPRVYFAMARDRVFPNWLSRVHPTKKIPLRAIWFQTLVASVFVALGSFYQILLYSGFVLVFFTTLTVSGLFLTTHHRILPFIFVVTNVVILFYASVSNPWEALWGLITILAGIPVYYYFKRRYSLDQRLEDPATLPEPARSSEA